MQNKKNKKLKVFLDLMVHSRIYSPFKRYTCGVGMIFTLHRITNNTPEEFSPNSILEITPEFLDAAIRTVKSCGYDIVTIDEVKQRLVDKKFDRKFVCFTIDDGYLDNLTQAFPVFQKHNAPFTVFINSGMLEGSTILWWQHLEDIIQNNQTISLNLSGSNRTFNTVTADEKHHAFDEIYWVIRAMDHSQQNDTICELLEQHKINPADLCQELSLAWQQVQKLSESGLATIGAHTLNHYALNKLSTDQVHYEIEQGQAVMERKIGIRSRHFAYPFGDHVSAAKREFDIASELSFETAVTQRKGVIVPEHAQHLNALPRVSLNGDFQNAAYLPVFLSGLPFYLFNRFKKLDVE